VLVFATILVADAIVFEASLSFLQAGVPDPAPSWGNVIAAGRNVLMAGAWWATFFPGILIMITVLCLNILSEGMTDAMVSPRARKITADAANTEESTHELEAVAGGEDTHVIPTIDTSVNLSVPSGVPDVLAPAAVPVVPLAERLAQLRERELVRTDRFVYTGDETPLLEVQDLCISFPRHGDVDVVDHVSFTVRPGETMSLVGESGCGCR